MVAGPEVSCLVAEYESLADAKYANERHHDQTEHAQRTMNEMGNRFQEETNDLLSLDTRTIATSAVAEVVISHHQNGRSRFQNS